MIAAVVWQISAHAIISRKCFGATCSPPFSRQYCEDMVRQVRWQAKHSSMHRRISAVNWTVPKTFRGGRLLWFDGDVSVGGGDGGSGWFVRCRGAAGQSVEEG